VSDIVKPWNDLIASYAPKPEKDSGGAARSTPPAAGSGDWKDDDRELLARTLDAEAGGEGVQGMMAAGAVINNRASAKGYGGSSIRDVILAPGQFSAWNSVTGYAGGKGALNRDERRPSQDAYRVADMLLSGEYEDPTGGATHYYNPDVADPKWGMRAGGDWQRIGNHVFGFADGRPGAGPGGSTAPTREEPTDYSRLWLDMGA